MATSMQGVALKPELYRRHDRWASHWPCSGAEGQRAQGPPHLPLGLYTATTNPWSAGQRGRHATHKPSPQAVWNLLSGLRWCHMCL